MAHTRSFDITDPADTDIVNGGALEIRDLKQDIEERMELDHYWAVELDTTVAGGDGYHKKLTMKPWEWTAATGDGPMLYTKDVDGTVELFYYDEAGNDVQITAEGKIIVYDYINPVAIYAEGTATTYGPIGFTTIIDACGNFSSNTFTVPSTGYYYMGVYNATSGLYTGSEILINNVSSVKFGPDGNYRLLSLPSTRMKFYNDVVLKLNVGSTVKLHGIGDFKMSIYRVLA